MELYQYNLKYAQAGLLVLKNYLLSKELFWPIHLSTESGHAPYPKLTIGNLLFYLKRAEACAQPSNSSASFAKVEDEVQSISYKWRSAWEDKAEKEFRSRQRQWQNFLTEIRSGEQSPKGNYATEVKLRTLLNLLSKEISVKTEIELQVYDQALRSKFNSGEFIWKQAYAPGFPVEEYWYLYGDIK